MATSGAAPFKFQMQGNCFIHLYTDYAVLLLADAAGSALAMLWLQHHSMHRPCGDKPCEDHVKISILCGRHKQPRAGCRECISSVGQALCTYHSMADAPLPRALIQLCSSRKTFVCRA
jgi:hypothetical protein